MLASQIISVLNVVINKLSSLLLEFDNDISSTQVSDNSRPDSQLAKFKHPTLELESLNNQIAQLQVRNNFTTENINKKMIAVFQGSFRFIQVTVTSRRSRKYLQADYHLTPCIVTANLLGGPWTCTWLAVGVWTSKQSHLHKEGQLQKKKQLVLQQKNMEQLDNKRKAGHKHFIVS